MSSTQKHDTVDSDWRQLEEFVDRLHELAHSPIEPDAFYRSLLEGCVSALAASSGAVWLPHPDGNWQLIHQINLPAEFDQKGSTTRQSFLNKVAATQETLVFSPHSGTEEQQNNPTDSVLVSSAVQSDASSPELEPVAIIELYMRAGASPAVQQGWQDMLSTICHIAASYHTFDQLRSLQAEQGLHSKSLALLRRINQPTDIRRTTFEIVNEGRSFVDCDRLSLVLRRGKSWHVAAVSGVDRIESRGDTAKKLKQLAACTAHWGEPIDSLNLEEPFSSEELPPELTRVLKQQLDLSHARRLIVVPIAFCEKTYTDSTSSQAVQPSAFLIAEQFDATATDLSCQRVVELSQLSEPTLRQAVRLNRFPSRIFLRWADRVSRIWQGWGISRLALATIAIAAIVAALIYVPYDFEIQAPATLVPVVERDVFASASGTIVDVQVVHGDSVQAGDILAVIDDPQIALDTQEISGEITTIRKRLEAISIARTDRNVQADTDRQRLPLSAEAEQLDKKLASLQQQQKILATHREALTIRSPIAGTVLTLDVQNLLRTRPVERGQALFKIADVQSGWQLWADVDQDQVGHILRAQQASKENLDTRIRFAGEESATFTGHIESISATAVLDPNELHDKNPTLRVKVAVDEQTLPAARPGMTAQVRIDCGQRSLGYVWLHDAWSTIYSWVVF